MRDEPSGRRALAAFLGLVIVIGGYWLMTRDRSSPASGGDSAAEIVEVGPQTLAQMLAMGNPGVLEFYTSNCPYCTKIAPELVKLNEQYGNRLFVLKMNAEKQPAEAVKYGVEAVPTLVYFDRSGNPQAVKPGYVTYDAIVKTLKQMKLVE